MKIKIKINTIIKFDFTYLILFIDKLYDILTIYFQLNYYLFIIPKSYWFPDNHCLEYPII